MTRSNPWGDPPEYLAAIAAGPAAYGRYCSRVIKAAHAAEAIRYAAQAAEYLADRRARNAEGMRRSRAAAKDRLGRP